MVDDDRRWRNRESGDIAIFSPPLDPVLALIPSVHYSFTYRVHRIRILGYEKRSEIFEREPKTADDDRTEKKPLTGPFVSPAKLDLSKF